MVVLFRAFTLWGLMIDAIVTSLVAEWRLALMLIGITSLLVSLPWIFIIPETVRKVGITRSITANYSVVITY